MRKRQVSIFFISLRYLFLILLAVFGFNFLYVIFLPLTLYPTSFLLSLFYDISISDNIIGINSFSIRLIEACIAGSAYFLLILLNFSIPIQTKKRIYSLIFSISSFLILNILRIFIFSILLVNSFKYFDLTHKIFWYAVSALLVFFIWFFTTKIFKIKNIPFYTDLKLIYSLIKLRKK